MWRDRIFALRPASSGAASVSAMASGILPTGGASADSGISFASARSRARLLAGFQVTHAPAQQQQQDESRYRRQKRHGEEIRPADRRDDLPRDPAHDDARNRRQS